MEKIKKIKWIEIIKLFIIVFIIYGIILFKKKYEDIVSVTDIVIADFLFFLFSVYLGWFLDNIRSRSEYHKNLRKYALLAVRRTDDTLMANGKLLEYLGINIKRIRDENIKNNLYEIKIILEIINESIKSSRIDWTDIIGEDLKKKEELEILENKLLTKVAVNDDKYFDDISKQIDKLRNEIPSILLRESEFDPTSPEFYSEIIADSLLVKIRNNKGILELTSRISKEDTKRLEEKKIALNLLQDHGMSKIWISIIGDDENFYGSIENPFVNFGKLRSSHIFYTILKLLAIIQPENASFSLGDGIKNRYTFKGITDYEINKVISAEYSLIILKINAEKLIK